MEQLDTAVAEKQQLLQRSVHEQQARHALQQEQLALQQQLEVSDSQRDELQAALAEMQREQAQLKELLDSMTADAGRTKGTLLPGTAAAADASGSKEAAGVSIAVQGQTLQEQQQGANGAVAALQRSRVCELQQTLQGSSAQLLQQQQQQAQHQLQQHAFSWRAQHAHSQQPSSPSSAPSSASLQQPQALLLQSHSATAADMLAALHSVHRPVPPQLRCCTHPQHALQPPTKTWQQHQVQARVQQQQQQHVLGRVRELQLLPSTAAAGTRAAASPVGWSDVQPHLRVNVPAASSNVQADADHSPKAPTDVAAAAVAASTIRPWQQQQRVQQSWPPASYAVVRNDAEQSGPARSSGGGGKGPLRVLTGLKRLASLTAARHTPNSPGTPSSTHSSSTMDSRSSGSSMCGGDSPHSPLRGGSAAAAAAAAGGGGGAAGVGVCLSSVTRPLRLQHNRVDGPSSHPLKLTLARSNRSRTGRKLGSTSSLKPSSNSGSVKNRKADAASAAAAGADYAAAAGCRSSAGVKLTQGGDDATVVRPTAVTTAVAAGAGGADSKGAAAAAKAGRCSVVSPTAAATADLHTSGSQSEPSKADTPTAAAAYATAHKTPAAASSGAPKSRVVPLSVDLTASSTPAAALAAAVIAGIEGVSTNAAASAVHAAAAVAAHTVVAAAAAGDVAEPGSSDGVSAVSDGGVDSSAGFITAAQRLCIKHNSKQDAVAHTAPPAATTATAAPSARATAAGGPGPAAGTKLQLVVPSLSELPLATSTGLAEGQQLAAQHKQQQQLLLQQAPEISLDLSLKHKLLPGALAEDSLLLAPAGSAAVSCTLPPAKFSSSTAQQPLHSSPPGGSSSCRDNSSSSGGSSERFSGRSSSEHAAATVTRADAKAYYQAAATAAADTALPSAKPLAAVDPHPQQPSSGFESGGGMAAAAAAAASDSSAASSRSSSSCKSNTTTVVCAAHTSLTDSTSNAHCTQQTCVGADSSSSSFASAANASPLVELSANGLQAAAAAAAGGGDDGVVSGLVCHLTPDHTSLHELLAATARQLQEVEACLAAQDALLDAVGLSTAQQQPAAAEPSAPAAAAAGAVDAAISAPVLPGSTSEAAAGAAARSRVDHHTSARDAEMGPPSPPAAAPVLRAASPTPAPDTPSPKADCTAWASPAGATVTTAGTAAASGTAAATTAGAAAGASSAQPTPAAKLTATHRLASAADAAPATPGAAGVAGGAGADAQGPYGSTGAAACGGTTPFTPGGPHAEGSSHCLAAAAAAAAAPCAAPRAAVSSSGGGSSTSSSSSSTPSSSRATQGLQQGPTQLQEQYLHHDVFGPGGGCNSCCRSTTAGAEGEGLPAVTATAAAAANDRLLQWEARVCGPGASAGAAQHRQPLWLQPPPHSVCRAVLPPPRERSVSWSGCAVTAGNSSIDGAEDRLLYAAAGGVAAAAGAASVCVPYLSRSTVSCSGSLPSEASSISLAPDWQADTAEQQHQQVLQQHQQQEGHWDKADTVMDLQLQRHEQMLQLLQQQQEQQQQQQKEQQMWNATWLQPSGQQGPFSTAVVAAAAAAAAGQESAGKGCCGSCGGLDTAKALQQHQQQDALQCQVSQQQLVNMMSQQQQQQVPEVVHFEEELRHHRLMIQQLMSNSQQQQQQQPSLKPPTGDAPSDLAAAQQWHGSHGGYPLGDSTYASCHAPHAAAAAAAGAVHPMMNQHVAAAAVITDGLYPEADCWVALQQKPRSQLTAPGAQTDSCCQQPPPLLPQWQQQQQQDVAKGKECQVQLKPDQQQLQQRRQPRYSLDAMLASGQQQHQQQQASHPYTPHSRGSCTGAAGSAAGGSLRGPIAQEHVGHVDRGCSRQSWSGFLAAAGLTQQAQKATGTELHREPSLTSLQQQQQPQTGPLYDPRHLTEQQQQELPAQEAAYSALACMHDQQHSYVQPSWQLSITSTAEPWLKPQVLISQHGPGHAVRGSSPAAPQTQACAAHWADRQTQQQAQQQQQQQQQFSFCRPVTAGASATPQVVAHSPACPWLSHHPVWGGGGGPAWQESVHGSATSSVMQLLLQGSLSGPGPLGVMHQVLLLLCPSSWQWLALIAAAVACGLKQRTAEAEAAATATATAAAAAATVGPAVPGARCRSMSSSGAAA